MKKFLLVAAFVLPFLACEDSPSGGTGAVNYSGNYKGEIRVHTNGTLTSTLADYTIEMVHGAGDLVTLNNNVFSANTGKITGTTLVLNKKAIPTSPNVSAEQTGTATFSGSNMSIQFKEEEIDLSAGTVLNTKTWTGTLVKQ